MRLADGRVLGGEIAHLTCPEQPLGTLLREHFRQRPLEWGALPRLEKFSAAERTAKLILIQFCFEQVDEIDLALIEVHNHSRRQIHKVSYEEIVVLRAENFAPFDLNVFLLHKSPLLVIGLAHFEVLRALC